MLRCGAALVFLMPWLTSCASSGKPIVRTETVEVAVPVIVAVPRELTSVPPEPVLPAGPLVNEDLANDRDAWQSWGRGLACQLWRIAGLGGGDTGPKPEGCRDARP